MSTPARAALESGSFRCYITTRALVTIASEMQALAVGWQIYAVTGRALDLGLVGLAQFLPGFCLFLLAGHAADRFPRKRILRCCYVAFSGISALLFGLTWHGLPSIWPVYAALLLNGTVRAFNAPASQAFLPLVVPEEIFPSAVAWSSSTSQASMIVGPMIGGLIYGIAGSPLAVYTGSAICYLTAMVLLGAVRTVPRPARPPARGSVIEGLRYLWRTRIVLGAISLDMFAVLLGGAVALLPVYAKDVLHAGATGLGILRGSPGAGAVITAIVLAHRPLRRRAGRVMLSCVAGFGAFTVAFGLSRSIVLSVAALMMAGACDIVSVIIRHTLEQTWTPDEMRGRVSAVNAIFIGASNEVGQFESGLTAAWLGARLAVVLGGLGTIAIVSVWSILFPELRRVDQLNPKSSK